MKTPEGVPAPQEELGREEEEKRGYIKNPEKAMRMAHISDQDRTGAKESRREADDLSLVPERREEERRRAEFLEKRAGMYEEDAKIQFETAEKAKSMTVEEREKLLAETIAEAEVAYKEMIIAKEKDSEDAQEKDRRYRDLSNQAFAIGKVIRGEEL